MTFNDVCRFSDLGFLSPFSDFYDIAGSLASVTHPHLDCASNLNRIVLTR